MNNELNETIKEGIKIKKFHNLSFVTIWKVGRGFSFNFDKQEVGFSTKEFGVKRTVVGVY